MLRCTVYGYDKQVSIVKSLKTTPSQNNLEGGRSLDNMSKVVVKYTYNAWGECITTVVDSTCEAIANLNPFRYRSYYFDTKTNLYFLKTRYYDPEVGRFITIDDTSYLAPDVVNGLNLYAYCGDNPVMRVDPNGTFFSWLSTVKDWGLSAKNWIIDTASDIKEFAINTWNTIDANVIQPIISDFNNFNWNNTDEQVTLDSNIFSAYKGKFVLRVPTVNGSSLSFGMIFLSTSASERTLKHEYGHTVQLAEMGPFKYLNDVGIPSVLAFWLDNTGKLPYKYYGSPWEHDADVKGGVTNRNHELWPENAYNNYWDLIKLFFT